MEMATSSLERQKKTDTFFTWWQSKVHAKRKLPPLLPHQGLHRSPKCHIFNSNLRKCNVFKSRFCTYQLHHCPLPQFPSLYSENTNLYSLSNNSIFWMKILGGLHLLFAVSSNVCQWRVVVLGLQSWEFITLAIRILKDVHWTCPAPFFLHFCMGS